jgi:aminoglycoside phosphotransferase (APT) family kinase protein
MVSTDIYPQPDAPDPVLDEHTVLEAARRHASQAGRLLQVDESGGEARAYHLEGDIVLKTQRPHRLRPRTSLAKEDLVLRTLERAGEFPVPRVLGYGHTQGIEYLCLTTMPGTAMRHLELTPPQRAAALKALGRTLRRLHEIDQTQLATSDLVPGDRSPADVRTRFADTFERLAQALNQTEGWDNALDVRAIAAARLAGTPAETDPVALHSNPGPEHTFAHADNGRFRGLIDFGDAYRSHPALDLRPWDDETDAQHLLTGYQSLGPLPEDFDHVRRTGLVLMALTRAARGSRGREETVASVERLLATE